MRIKRRNLGDAAPSFDVAYLFLSPLFPGASGRQGAPRQQGEDDSQWRFDRLPDRE